MNEIEKNNIKYIKECINVIETVLESLKSAIHDLEGGADE